MTVSGVVIEMERSENAVYGHLFIVPVSKLYVVFVELVVDFINQFSNSLDAFPCNERDLKKRLSA